MNTSSEMVVLEITIDSPNNRPWVTPQDFLFLNFVAAMGLGLLFLRSRKKARPTRLRFAKTANSVSAQQSGAVVEDVLDKSYNEVRPKNLNVIFMYNGHSWDAYEVLGVPAGSSLNVVEEHYQKAMKSCNKDSTDFLRAAFEAIRANCN